MGKVVDLEGVKTEFPVVEPGDYVATITKGEYREAGSEKAKNSKEDMENVEFTIKHALDDEDDVEFEGSKVFKNFNLGTNSLWSWKKFAVAAGADSDLLETAIDPEEVTNDLIGSDLVVSVGTREWSGRILNEVKDTKPLSDFE